MTKQDILDYFNDINQVYNDCTRLDSLSNMIDEMLETALGKENKYVEYPKADSHKAYWDNIGRDRDFVMDEDAKQASIPYTYNAPQHDYKCGYPNIN